MAINPITGQTQISPLFQMGQGRLQQPTSHQHGGLGKIALAAAMAMSAKKQREAQDLKQTEAATALANILGGGEPAQPGQFDFSDPAGIKALMANPFGAEILKAELQKQMGPKSQVLTGEQAQALGFQPGTVVQQTGSDFDVLQQPSSAAQRQITKDANGRQRFVDTGELVFPNVEKALAGDLKPTEISGLRKDFVQSPTTKVFQEQAKSYRELEAIAKKGVDKMTAQDDIAMLIKFMKINDPGSVVREGEFATAAQSMGLGQRIIQLAAKVDKGERLTPEARQAFLDTSLDMFSAAVDTFDESRNNYRAFLTGEFPERIGDKNIDRFTPDYAEPFREQIQRRNAEVSQLQTPELPTPESLGLPPGSRILGVSQ